MSLATAPRSLSRTVSTVSFGCGPGACRRASASSPTPGAAVRSAAITYVQKDAGSLSPRSSDNHAASRSPAGVAGPAASHSLSSVVLPNPAGAETRTSLDAAPRSSRSLSRGRGTRPRRDPGTYNFVLSRAAGPADAGAAGGGPGGTGSALSEG